MKRYIDNWLLQSNADFQEWLWRWFVKWAVVAAIAIILTSPTKTQAYGIPFFSGSSWMNEGAVSYSGPAQQGVTNGQTGLSGWFRMFCF